MILETLMELLYSLFDIMLAFEIPNLPTQVYEYVQTCFQYMATGAGILANYIPFAYLVSLFAVLLTIDGSIMIYHFVLWIIKKIPMGGMS